MKLIAAVDENWAIGKDGDQFLHLKDDLARFYALTAGKTVIMGRKTLAALHGGRPLRGRENLILSADPQFTAEGAKVFRSLEELLAYAPADSFVVGGGTVYRQLLPYCNAAYITKIHAAFPADTWHPNLDALDGWRITEEFPPIEEQGFTYHYTNYAKE
jgi:dihydrofolate reductase